MQKTKDLRAALYARVSTSDQQDCENQLRELRLYVKARGWKRAAEFTDRVSGAKDKRPGMDDLMNAARKREIDAIIVWKIDRWGRSLPHLVASLQELDAAGVRFIAVTQGIDTDQSNPTGRLLLQIMGAFAEYERSLIVERVNAGIARVRAQGKKLGRPRAAVRSARVAQLRNRGLTMREIASATGVSVMTIQRILKVA